MPNGEQGFGQSGKESSFDRVTIPGLSDDDKKVVLADLAESFKNPPEVKGELEKTPEEKEIIVIANQVTSQIIKSLGLVPLEVPENNVKILEKIERGEKTVGGEMDAGRQIILLQRVESRLLAFARTAHEMFHMKSFGAFQVLDNDSLDVDFRARGGFVIISRDGSEEFFVRLNEAVTESLSASAVKNITESKPSVFSEEITETEVAKQGFDAVDLYGDSVPGDEIYFARRQGDEIDGQTFVYRKERTALNMLIEKIYQSHQEMFENQSEVIDQFYRAYFSGKILEVGKLIDRTFGKGVFRRIGKAKTGEEFAAVVNSL